MNVFDLLYHKLGGMESVLGRTDPGTGKSDVQPAQDQIRDFHETRHLPQEISTSTRPNQRLSRNLPVASMNYCLAFCPWGKFVFERRKARDPNRQSGESLNMTAE